jgi:hypothetical protein
MLGIGIPPVWPGWLAPPAEPPPDVPELELDPEPELDPEAAPELEPEPPVRADAFASRERWPLERDGEFDVALAAGPLDAPDGSPLEVAGPPCASLPEPSLALAKPSGEDP